MTIIHIIMVIMEMDIITTVIQDMVVEVSIATIIIVLQIVEFVMVDIFQTDRIHRDIEQQILTAMLLVQENQEVILLHPIQVVL